MPRRPTDPFDAFFPRTGPARKRAKEFLRAVRVFWESKAPEEARAFVATVNLETLAATLREGAELRDAAFAVFLLPVLTPDERRTFVAALERPTRRSP